ncbi:MAG: hypothetical protein KF726_25355 [Anaerolineae bacterium]|nr:hypothetical protein [Anaerolineae bacterium]
MRRSLIVGTCVAILATSIALTQIGTASAQGPGGGRGPGRGGPSFLGNPLVCSTTDYTEIAATALGITAADLRVALVSGKSLEQVATEKGVDSATLQTALDNAYKADIAKATEEGIYTEPSEVVIAKPSEDADSAVPNKGSVEVTVWHMGGRGLISAHNEVQPMIVAADALDMSCADLVKATRDSGTSVVQVAADKGVSIQTVVDALVKAYQDATAKDVSEGLITEAQATAQNRNLVQRVTQMISMPGGMMMGGKFGVGMGAIQIVRPGRGDFGGGGPGRQQRPGASKDPSAQQTPEATLESTPNA